MLTAHVDAAERVQDSTLFGILFAGWKMLGEMRAWPEMPKDERDKLTAAIVAEFRDGDALTSLSILDEMAREAGDRDVGLVLGTAYLAVSEGVVGPNAMKCVTCP